MTNALPTSTDNSLLKFFELQHPAFDRLTDPSELYLTEQHSFLSAHLADAMEERDMLVVVCGQPGSGKSSLLARYSTTVYDSICLASIDDTCSDPVQFYSTVLGQFGFGDISGTVDQLKHICMEFLKQQGKAGDPVVLLVDNAHRLRPEIFEQLRWTAGIQHENSPIVNLVLAGHPDLAMIMESPAMSQISAKHHVRFNIRAYTEDETANYIWHRLELAGDRQCVQFSDESHSLIFRYSGGIPGLINLVCNEALQELFRQKKKTVSAEVVRRVAERQNLIPHVVPIQNKSRRKTDSGYVDETMQKKAIAAQDDSALSATAVEKAKSTENPELSENKAARSNKSSASNVTNRTPTAATKRSAASALSIVEKVATLSEQLGDLRARKKDLELELFQRDSTIASLEDQLKTETQLHREASEKLQTGSGETESLRKKLNKTRAKLKSQTVRFDGLSGNAKNLQEQLDMALGKGTELAQALSTADARIEILQERLEVSASLQSVLRDREQQVKDLQAVIQEREAAIQVNRADAAGQAALIESLKTEIDEGEKAAQEIVSLQETIQEQTLQLESLQDMVDSDAATDKDFAAFKSKIRELEKELKSARTDYQKLEKEHVSAAEHDEQLATELETLTQQMAADSEQKEKALNEVLTLKAELEKSEQNIHDMQSQLHARDEHADWLKAELDRLQGADEQLAKVNIENQASQKQLLHTSHDLESANTEILQLTEELDSARVSIRQHAETQRVLESVRQDMADTEARVARLTEEKAGLEASLAQTSETLRKLERSSGELLQNNESLEGMLGDVTTRLADNELKTRTLRADKEQLSAENNGLIDELETLRGEASQAASLKGQFEKQKELNAKLSATINEQTQEIAELSTSLAEQAITHSKAAAALSNMNKLQPEIGELREQIADMNAQLLVDQENSRSFNELLESKDQQYIEVESELANMRAFQAELHGALESAHDDEAAQEQVQQEIETLRRQLEVANDNRANHAAADNNVAELNEALADKERQKEALSVELDESRAQLNDIQKEFAREAKDNHELQQQLLALAEIEEQLREELLHRSDIFDDLSMIENERNQLREENERLRRIHDSSREKRIPAPEPEMLPVEKLSYQLELRHGERSIEIKNLVGEGEKLLIGRGEQSDITVDSEFVSRSHLLISVYSGRLFVKDLHSTNGTFVNGKRISHCEMHDGDVIGIGEHSISLKTSPCD